MCNVLLQHLDHHQPFTPSTCVVQDSSLSNEIASPPTFHTRLQASRNTCAALHEASHVPIGTYATLTFGGARRRSCTLLQCRQPQGSRIHRLPSRAFWMKSTASSQSFGQPTYMEK